MKLNKLFFGLLSLSALLFAACDDDYEVPASPVVDANCAALRFSTENLTSLEVDPAVPEFSIKMIRDAQNEATYTLQTVEDGQGSFVVPGTISFAAGEAEKDLVIKLSDNAKVGVPLTLSISVSEQDINPYKEALPNYIASVSVVKWNDLGEGQFCEGFLLGDDDGNPMCVLKTRVYQRDDKPEVFRIPTPYTPSVLSATAPASWLGGNNQDYLVFTLGKNDLLTWDGFFYTGLLYQGADDIKAYFPSTLSSTLKDYDALSEAVRDDAGNILYFHYLPYYYIDALEGGFGLIDCYVGFPGFDLAGFLGTEVEDI